MTCPRFQLQRQRDVVLYITVAAFDLRRQLLLLVKGSLRDIGHFPSKNGVMTPRDHD